MHKLLKRKYVTVDVTKEHIKQGVRCSPANDPISLALREKGYNASVGLKQIRFGRVFKSRTPDHVKEFIQEFDTGVKVKPIQFKLGVPVNTP